MAESSIAVLIERFELAGFDREQIAAALHGAAAALSDRAGSYQPDDPHKAELLLQAA